VKALSAELKPQAPLVVKKQLTVSEKEPEMPILSTSELVAAIRQKAGYSQEALARVLSVSYPTVNSWERGRSSPRPQHLAALADLADDLGVSRGLIVLVIDDDAAACLVAEGFMVASEHPAAVTTTTDASEGLLMCGSLRPDLLLIDVLMPGLDGFEVARKVEAIPGLEHTRVVLVTSSTDPDIERRALDSGHSLVHKPLTQEAVDVLLQGSAVDTSARVEAGTADVVG
jgi:CheY-like chemotaxis protein/DNA-binding transcriptional regulator YiaG